MPNRFSLTPGAGDRQGSQSMTTVAIVGDSLGGIERAGNLAALFPQVSFDIVQDGWRDMLPLHTDILIAAVDAAAPAEMEQALAHLRKTSVGLRTAIVLRNADVTSTRRLMQGGAADVLPAPVSEAALALSLERLLSHPNHSKAREEGEVVAFIKAGGGVGATTLAVQVAALLASRSGENPSVCLADLDLQFGVSEFYLDLNNAVSVTDCLASGVALADTPFASQLTPHRSGVRVLASPPAMTTLDLLTPPIVDAMFSGLRRNFALTLVDLPMVWTAWTNRVLELANRIVLVTNLSVPHTHLVRRQLAVLQSQLLGDKPLVLVCNALNADSTATVSIKAAERAIGRPFDVVVPQDARVVNAAINQGLLISEVKRKTKVERAIGELAGKIMSTAPQASRPAK